jgi:hypothetical protein
MVAGHLEWLCRMIVLLSRMVVLLSRMVHAWIKITS